MRCKIVKNRCTCLTLTWVNIRRLMHVMLSKKTPDEELHQETKQNTISSDTGTLAIIEVLS